MPSKKKKTNAGRIRVSISDNVITRGNARRRSRVRKQQKINNGFIGPRNRPKTYQYACSQVDPWACSACIPDGAQNTGCYSVKQDVGLSTGTGTACAVAWNVLTQAQVFTDSGSANPTPTITGNWAAAANNASINALYSKSRPVSAGIRCTYIGNTQTDGGVILCGIVSGSTPLNAFAGLPLGNAQVLFLQYKTLPLRGGCKLTWYPEDMEDTMQFAVNSTASVSVGNGFNAPYLLVLVYQANPSSGILHAEAIANYEGQFESQSFMPGGLSENGQKVEAETGWYETAKTMLAYAEHITSFLPSVANNVMSGVKSASALGSMANGIMSSGLMSRSGLPRLTYPGYT